VVNKAAKAQILQKRLSQGCGGKSRKGKNVTRDAEQGCCRDSRQDTNVTRNVEQESRRLRGRIGKQRCLWGGGGSEEKVVLRDELDILYNEMESLRALIPSMLRIVLP
jgi:hypothetical protein